MRALRSFRNIVCALVGVVLIVVSANFSYAGLIPGYPDAVTAYDPREVALLPRYCPYTQDFRSHVPGGNNPDEIQRWTAVIGPTFIHMHHYCWGLMKTYRGLALAPDEQTRRFYLSDAINEFDYVIGHAPADFVLLPEIFMKKGENLIRLGNGGDGILQLLRATDLKPDYWPPYAIMSDYYKDHGNLKDAREILEKGLSASPDAKVLKERLANLDAAKK